MYQRAAFLYQTTTKHSNLPTVLATLIAELLATTSETALQQIYKKTHPQVRWLYPEKRVYKKNELEAHLAEAEQQQQKPLIFIIANAELLQEQSANSLLKILEEPPTNIFFVLTTTNEQQILPTIRSRLLLLPPLTQDAIDTTHPLIQFFISYPVKPIKELHEILKDKSIDDINSKALFDSLIAAWHEQDKIGNSHARHVLKILLFFAQKPPMPGSSRLFWRTIYASLSVNKNLTKTT